MANLIQTPPYSDDAARRPRLLVRYVKDMTAEQAFNDWKLAMALIPSGDKPDCRGVAKVPYYRNDAVRGDGTKSRAMMVGKAEWPTLRSAGGYPTVVGANAVNLGVVDIDGASDLSGNLKISGLTNKPAGRVMLEITPSGALHLMGQPVPEWEKQEQEGSLTRSKGQWKWPSAKIDIFSGTLCDVIVESDEGRHMEVDYTANVAIFPTAGYTPVFMLDDPAQHIANMFGGSIPLLLEDAVEWMVELKATLDEVGEVSFEIPKYRKTFIDFVAEKKKQGYGAKEIVDKPKPDRAAKTPKTAEAEAPDCARVIETLWEIRNTAPDRWFFSDYNNWIAIGGHLLAIARGMAEEDYNSILDAWVSCSRSRLSDPDDPNSFCDYDNKGRVLAGPDWERAVRQKFKSLRTLSDSGWLKLESILKKAKTDEAWSMQNELHAELNKLFIKKSSAASNSGFTMVSLNTAEEVKEALVMNSNGSMFGIDLHDFWQRAKIVAEEIYVTDKGDLIKGWRAEVLKAWMRDPSTKEWTKYSPIPYGIGPYSNQDEFIPEWKVASCRINVPVWGDHNMQEWRTAGVPEPLCRDEINHDLRTWLRLLVCICGCEYEVASYALKWFAFKVHRPGILPGTSLIAGGEEGVAKNTVLDSYSHLFGEFSQTMKGESIGDRFDSDVIGKAIINVSELDFVSPAKINILKASITDIECKSEEKFVSKKDAMRTAGYLVSGNSQVIIKIVDDPRRWVIMTSIPPNEKTNKRWAKELRGALASGAERHGAFMRQLLALLVHFGPVSILDLLAIPKGRVYEEMKNKSRHIDKHLSPLDSFIRTNILYPLRKKLMFSPRSFVIKSGRARAGSAKETGYYERLLEDAVWMPDAEAPNTVIGAGGVPPPYKLYASDLSAYIETKSRAEKSTIAIAQNELVKQLLSFRLEGKQIFLHKKGGGGDRGGNHIVVDVDALLPEDTWPVDMPLSETQSETQSENADENAEENADGGGVDGVPEDWLYSEEVIDGLVERLLDEVFN